MNLNQAVFTTSSILKLNQPILHIYHDDSNDWQFLGHDGADMDKLMIVSLQEILNYDSSLTDILHIAENFQASRKTIADQWIITPWKSE